MTFTILKFVFCSSSGTISIFIWLLSISILYFIMAHFFALTFISNIITNYCVYSLIDYKRFLYVRESAGSLTVYFPQWKKKASAKGPPKEALDGSTWAMKAVLDIWVFACTSLQPLQCTGCAPVLCGEDSFSPGGRPGIAFVTAYGLS